MAETMRDQLGFQSSRADQDVWFCKAIDEQGNAYYEYVLVYTDDLLCLSKKVKELMTSIEHHYMVKPNSIGLPERYLGAMIRNYRFPDDPAKEHWFMSSEQYVKEAVQNVKQWLADRNGSLKTKATSVLPSGYKPELDVSEYCEEEDFEFFQQQIGVLRWAVELGQIDIAGEVSMLSSYLAAPRTGHVTAILHIFSYLDRHDRSKIVFDSEYQDDLPKVEKPDWIDWYPDAKEMLPPDMPEPLGKEVQIICFCDADHAVDQITRRS